MTRAGRATVRRSGSARTGIGDAAALLRGALDRVLPPACVACGRGQEPGAPPVCAGCWHRLPGIPLPRCARCGATAPRREMGATGGAPRVTCAECEGWAPELEAAGAPFRMEGDAALLVRRLKYDGWTALAEPMGRAMAPVARRLLRAGDPPPALVPVPLSRARRRERGFNQAEILADSLARTTGWRVVRALERARAGRRQARLGRRGREENVLGLFRPAADPTGPGVGGRWGDSGGEMRRASPPVLLVDDVVTTGATASACARTLAEGGLRCAGVVSFARALRAIDGG